MQKITLFLFAIALLVGCKVNHEVTDIQGAYMNNEGSQPVDSSLVKFMKPYSVELQKVMGELVIYADVAMDKGLPESAMTNCVTDIFLENSREIGEDMPSMPYPDMAYINYYSLRASLPKGKVSLRNLYETFPFENEIVFLQVTGDKLVDFANVTAQRGGDCIAGMRMTITKDGKAGQITIQGKPLDINKKYWLVTSDYIANGGDNMVMFTNPLRRVDSGVKVRDSYIDYMKAMHENGQTLTGEKDGRIIYE